MAKNKSDSTDMTETVHFSVPFTNYHEDATFGKESIAMSHLKVPKEWKGSHESGSFDYRFQSGDTTHDDIKTVIRSGHTVITMHRQYALNTLHPNISYQTEHQKEYDPTGPILNILPESYHTVNIQSDPNVCYMTDGKNITFPTESLLSGCLTVSNEVQNPLENMTGEAIADQEARPPIVYLGHTNDQVTLQAESNTMDLTVTDWTKDSMHGPMLSSSDLNLFTRRHTYDQLDPCLKMRNNQVPRPRSYHGPEISNKSSSVSGILIGSDQRKGYVRIRRSGNLSGELSSNLTSSNRSLTSSKFSVISSKLETPEDEQVQKQHEELQFRSTLNVCISVTFTIISLLLFFVDWATDIILAHMYLIQNEFDLFWVTIAFIIGPALVCAAVDLYWFYHDHLNNLSDSFSRCALHSEVQNTNEGDTRRESRVCVKYEFSSYVENITSSGCRKKEMLNKTRYKSQNSTRETYQKSKQDFLEETTQNTTQDESQEVEQGVCCTNWAASSHGEGQEKLNLYSHENFQDNTHDISLRYTSRKSQISTSNKSSDSEEDQCSSSSQKSGQPVQNTRHICSHVLQEFTELKREEDRKRFPEELSSEKLSINTEDKSIHSQDKPIHSEDMLINSDDRSMHSEYMLINSDDRSMHSEDMGINSDDRSIHSEDMGINSDDRSMHSEDMGINSDDRSMHSDDMRINSDDRSMHSEEMRMNSDDRSMHSAHMRINSDERSMHSEDMRINSDDRSMHSEDMRINSDDRSMHSGDMRISSDDKSMHSEDMRINSDDRSMRSVVMRINSDDKSMHSGDMRINSDDKSMHSEDMRINSDDKSVHSQHKTINLQGKHIYSQDKTQVCPDIRCQVKINTFDFITTHHSVCFRRSNVWVGFRIFVGILSLGRVFRCCEYIYHVIKSHQNGPNAIYHYLRALEEKRDYKLLDLIYASTESAPQFFLQLYIVFMFNLPLKTERVLSLVASVAGISWTVVSSYMHNKAALPEGRHLTIAAQVLIFLARLCEISARITSIALFETYFNSWSLVLIIHFIIMLLWIQKQNPSLEGVAYSKHFRVLFKLFFSYVLVICFINLKCNRSKYRMVFYYVLTYGENFVFAGLVLWRGLKSWKMEEEEHYRIYCLAVIPIGLILHVMFQILFYSCCHRNRRS